jgi:hypothetical protein
MFNAGCRPEFPTAVTYWSTTRVTIWAWPHTLATTATKSSVVEIWSVISTVAGTDLHLVANVSSSWQCLFLFFCREIWFISRTCSHLYCFLFRQYPLKTAVYCLEPPIINNGGFRLSTNSTVAGTVVEYYCLSNSRYRMSGPSRIVCQSDGHYDRDPPVCIGM